MFAGEDIPYTPPAVELPPDVDPTAHRLPPLTSDCLGTYGGKICTEGEALHPKAVYNLSNGDVERPAVPKTLTSRKKKRKQKYVHTCDQLYVPFNSTGMIVLSAWTVRI